ncbi:MAG: tetratricopeptide repeat protein [Ignavibacteria bacterium]|nr:tetratricopeptide repeat protein [Ignavibacteria bacterium]
MEQAAVARMLGNIFFKTALLDDSNKWYCISLDLFSELGDTDGVAKVTGNLGSLYRHKGENTVALKYFEDALALHRANKSLTDEAVIIGNIGNLYLHTSNYPLALEYYLRALTIHEELNDESGIRRVTGNIGILYRNTGDYKKALEWLHRALELRMKANDQAGLASVHGNLGNVYASMGNTDEAFPHVVRAIEYSEKVGDHKIRLGATVSKINLLIRSDKAAEARQLAASIEEELRSTGNNLLLLELAINLAELCIIEGNIDEAMTIAQSCLDEAVSQGRIREQFDATSLIYHISKLKGDFETALVFHERASQIESDLIGLETQRQFLMMESEQRLSDERKQVERERTIALEREALLHSILPASIADRLLKGEKKIADTYDNVSVLFLDMVDFTSLASRIPPVHLIYLLDAVFAAADKVMIRHKLTKIKTIGDAYLAVSGLPEPMTDNVGAAALAAVDLLTSMNELVLQMPK